MIWFLKLFLVKSHKNTLLNLKVIFGKRWDVQLVELNNLPWIFMEKIWYDPHEKSPRVDKILSQMSDLQTFELTQVVFSWNL